MNTNPKILVIVEPDFEPGVVVNRAIWIAKLMDCEIHLLQCDPIVNPFPKNMFALDKSGELERAMIEIQEEFVDQLASSAREEGLDVTTHIINERPIADAILAYAEQIEPKFLMKGTQYHSGAERSMLVDTDWQLARTCPFPIWFVKNSERELAPVVVAAVDPTHSHDKPAVLDDTIIQTSKSVAELIGADVHLFHSYERLTELGTQAIRRIKPVKLEIDKIDKRIQKEHREALDALAERNDVAAEFVHQLPGRTRELLPSFVRSRNAQLVVMGALSRWGIKRMVIGSTAERVMDHLPCDILIVR